MISRSYLAVGGHMSILTKVKKNNKNEYAAIVLAAGMSSRMGENKLILKLGNKTVLEWTIYNIIKGGFSPEDVCLVVSTNMFKNDIKSLVIPAGVNVVCNSKAHLGQSTSMKKGLDKMRDRKGVFFFLGDQPFIDPDDIIRLRKSAENKSNSIIVPVTENGKKGNPAVFPRKYYDDLLMVQGDRGGRDVIENPVNDIHTVNLYKSFIHFDLDTPEDYEEAKRLFKKWN